MCLLVSHGDTLKILQSGFQRQSPTAHVDPALVPLYRTGEIRALRSWTFRHLRR